MFFKYTQLSPELPVLQRTTSTIMFFADTRILRRFICRLTGGLFGQRTVCLRSRDCSHRLKTPTRWRYQYLRIYKSPYPRLMLSWPGTRTAGHNIVPENWPLKFFLKGESKPEMQKTRPVHRTRFQLTRAYSILDHAGSEHLSDFQQRWFRIFIYILLCSVLTAKNIVSFQCSTMRLLLISSAMLFSDLIFWQQRCGAFA